MIATGLWDLVISTPIGRQDVVLELTEHAGSLAGVARDKHGDVELVDLRRDGDRLTWAQSITKPIRLNLTFDVRVDGDHLEGTSKAGPLPTSRVAGSRRSMPPADAHGGGG